METKIDDALRLSGGLGIILQEIGMGIYYVIACDELKEKIEPGSINNLGIKQRAIAHPDHPFGPVSVFALVTRWRDKAARVLNDGGDDPGYFEYTDVTQQIIDEYNSEYRTALKFTGDDDDA